MTDNKFLKKSTYFYDLPEEQIAQTPAMPRDSSRLLVCDNGKFEHKHFYNIIDYLEKGDVLVLNDSRVIPARIFGEKIREDGTLGSHIETLLLSQKEEGVWEAIVRPGKKAVTGKRFSYGNGLMVGEIVDVKPDGNRIIKFEYDRSKNTFFTLLDKIGTMPLPPYITEKLKDQSRYQTVYANERGSAAAPTAGLHFTTELLEKIREKGVTIAPVMLHVGLGTFRPVKADNILEHKMHSEFYSVTHESADIINNAKKEGRRVICVGTTSLRTLEGASDEKGFLKPGSGNTDIFIYPGYRFKVVDALITNFHLPESTLIMLVSAFMGYDNTMNAYKCAVKEKYRFFSFGDAMFIKIRNDG